MESDLEIHEMQMNSVQRCPDLPAHWGSEVPCRIIGHDNWDGPAQGVLQCGKCAAEYIFDLIDWDEREGDDDIRIFSLSPLPRGAFDALVEAHPKAGGDPFWPVWMPRWEFASKEDEKSARQRTDEILSRAGKPELVMAWLGCWPNRIIVVKPLTEADRADLEFSLSRPRSANKGRDWFAFLGLERGDQTIHP